MTHDELFELHKKFFGDPVAHYPEDCPDWKGTPCTVFFASCARWTPFRLNHCINFHANFHGPYTPASSPVKIPYDGYIIFVPDN